MSELTPRRTYSPAAQRVMAAFAGRPAKLAEYQRRGLIWTNNLVWKMKVYTEGREGELGRHFYDDLVPPRIGELLERARTRDPELWDETLAHNEAQADLLAECAAAMLTIGADNPITEGIRDRLRASEWQGAALKTRIFDIIDEEPLDPEDALELCS